MKNKTLQIRQIQEAVARVKEMSVETIYIKSRKREIVAMRQLCMCFSKQFTQLSLAEIGIYNGVENHATVIHAIKTVRNMVETKNEMFVPDYYRILDILNKTPGMVLQKQKKSVITKRRLMKVKELIRHRVPYETRKRILDEIQVN